MRACLSLFLARFKQGLQYRKAAWAGAATQIGFGLFIVSILEAFNDSNPDAAGFAFGLTASYAWLGQATLALLPWNPDPEMRNTVRSGEVAMDLLKPADLYWSWFARALGYRLSGALLRFVPCLLFAMFALPALGLGSIRLSPPASIAAGLAWAITLPGAALLSASITVFYALFYFKSVAATGAQAMATAVTTFCSGLVVPLPLLPEGLADFLSLSPFAYVTDASFKLWNGQLPPGDVPRVLAMQVLWIAVCALAGKAWVARSVAGLEIAGG